jgi:hypothetical protein
MQEGCFYVNTNIETWLYMEYVHADEATESIWHQMWKMIMNGNLVRIY